MIKNLWSKLGLLVSVMSCAAVSTYGQITLGAKAGLNLNQFSQPGTAIGANVGIYGSYSVTPFLTAKLEPQYSQEGGGRPDYFRDYSTISDNVSGIQFINPSVTFHNLQIPLLLELTLPEFQDESVIPKLLLGASYGLMMSATEQHTKRYYFTDNNSASGDIGQLDVAYQKENVIDNYARNQWSVIGGFGMQYKLASRTFSFDIRYRHGLNSLNQLRFISPSFAPGTGGNLRSSTVSFNFSMSIFNF